jgi:hypothetical protein
MPILICKRRRGHKHFEGDPFVTHFIKITKVVYTLLMLVYSAL